MSNGVLAAGVLYATSPRRSSCGEPAPDAVQTDQTVTITDAEPGAVIHYTLDGSLPSPSSPVYSAPLLLDTEGMTTVQAIAVKAGMQDSEVASASYELAFPVATPELQPPGGTYASDQAVAITSATADATIYYTTDGSEPTVLSTEYSGPIAVAGHLTSVTIKAIAVASGLLPSAVVSGTYLIMYPLVAIPRFDPPAGTYDTDQSVTISCATSGAKIYYTTDGSVPTTSSAVYGGPIAVAGLGTTMTIRVLAVKSGMAPRFGSASYAIECRPEEHDGGDGTCVALDACSAGYYLTNEGSCVRFTAVAAGLFYSCGLRSDGDIACWGGNSYGEAPASVTGPFSSVSAGLNHTCGLRSGGDIACWGNNVFGQALASVTGPFSSVSAGSLHTCGLRSGGDIACWGDNVFGQAPASVTGPFLSVVSGGFLHTCGLRSSGDIACWGDNLYGQAPSVVYPQ